MNGKQYAYPAPLYGYTDLPPLSSDRNADGKSFANPQTGIKSTAYQRFTDPISNGVRGGFDIHIYYDSNKPGDAQYAQDLWERIRREFPELRIYKIWDRPTQSIWRTGSPGNVGKATLFPMLFLIIVLVFASFFNHSQSTQYPFQDMSASQPRKIVIIGGGAIGSSTAYFLTRHRFYDPKIHSVTILEASKIAGGSSGKAGGFIADWATPKCLAPLSFRTHNELSKRHNGDQVWGHRLVYAAEIKLQGRVLDKTSKDGESGNTTAFSKALDWLAPGAIQSYDEIGTSKNSGQLAPYAFTTALAELAKEKGAEIVTGSATTINYSEDRKGVESVTYKTNDQKTETLDATDIILAAGHSIVVKPSRDLSPYILFPNITAAPDSTLGKLISPDIYPRPADRTFEYHTVYLSGPDDYSVPLPKGTDRVEVDAAQVQEIWDSIRTVSQEIHGGNILVKQTCYKPQIRKHEEDEEVGPMVGPMSVQGLWLATGHDEWGIQNAPGTGVVMSEMIFEGECKSADCTSLHPKNFLE